MDRRRLLLPAKSVDDDFNVFLYYGNYARKSYTLVNDEFVSVESNLELTGAYVPATYAKGKYWVADNSKLYASNDGLNYELITTVPQTISSIISLDDYLFVCDKKYIHYTKDFKTWNYYYAGRTPSNANILSIGRIGDNYYASGDNLTIKFELDMTFVAIVDDFISNSSRIITNDLGTFIVQRVGSIYKVENESLVQIGSFGTTTTIGSVNINKESFTLCLNDSGVAHYNGSFYRFNNVINNIKYSAIIKDGIIVTGGEANGYASAVLMKYDGTKIPYNNITGNYPVITIVSTYLSA